MNDDDLQSRLEDLGRAHVPAVDPNFADNLESQLRVMVAEPTPGPFWRQMLRPSVVVAALLAVAGITFFATRSTTATSLEFAAAQGTSVSIPGEADLSQGEVGQRLPEGARITVGPEGSASVGGVVLEPGTVAIVVNGIVEVLELPPEPIPETPTTSVAPVVADDASTTTTVAPPTTTASTEQPAGRAPTDDTPATAPPTTEPETQPTVTTTTPSTTTTVAPAVEAPTTTSTTLAPTTTQPDAPAAEPVVTLTITPGDNNGQAMLRWTVEGSTADIAGWVVRRGRGEDSEIAAVLRRPEARRQRVTLPDRNVAWVVVARNADGDVITRSNVVRAN